MSQIQVNTINEYTGANGVTIDGLLIKDGAIPSIAGSGLVHINTSTFSTASSHSVGSCFSSTYTNYKIVIKLSAVTGSNIDFLVRLRSSSTDATSGYRTTRQMASGTAMAVATDPTGTDDWTLGFISTTGTEVHSGTIDLFDPYASTPTQGTSSFSGYFGGAQYLTACDMLNTNTTSYDGITFFPASGTINGTVSVYGYATS
tara:strand:- start:1253 stop:1858 length:606 start_codon:yes stop_codon:yes gene_type:complete